MSLLVLQLPPRERLGARGNTADPLLAGQGGGLAGVPLEWHYVLSADGHTPTLAGHAGAAFLPKADQVIVLLAEADVSWHQVDVPRAPAARLHEALAGVMEERLLDEGQAPHFALAADAKPGQSGWVAVTDGQRLAAALQALENSGLSIERVVSAALPGASPRGHFHTGGHGYGSNLPDVQEAWLTLSGVDGVLHVRLQGGLARTRLAAGTSSNVRWSSTPAAALAAERWLGTPVPLMSDAERALEAAQPAVNLRQFALAQRTRGTRALRQAAKRLLSEPWRPVRVGLLALVGLQLAGLNLVAWQQRQLLADKREAMTTLLKSAHPGVRAVLDAPVQMERETDRLRSGAGRVGAGDLESMLAVAASAWPDGQGPTATLRFEPGSLSMVASGWAQAQVQQFRERSRAAGYAAEFSEGRVVLTRAKLASAL